MPRWLDRLKGKKARDVPGVAESAAMVPSSLAAEENVAVAKPAEEHASKDPTVFDVKSAERAFDETDDGKRLDAENFSAMVPYERDKARTVYAQKRAKFYHGLMSDEQRAYTRGLCQDILRENDNRVTNIGIVPGPLLLHAGHIADKESMRDAPIYLTTNPDIIGNNDGVNGYISSSPDRVMAAFSVKKRTKIAVLDGMEQGSEIGPGIKTTFDKLIDFSGNNEYFRNEIFKAHLTEMNLGGYRRSGKGNHQEFLITKPLETLELRGSLDKAAFVAARKAPSFVDDVSRRIARPVSKDAERE